MFAAWNISEGSEGKKLILLKQEERWQKQNATEKIWQGLATTGTEEQDVKGSEKTGFQKKTLDFQDKDNCSVPIPTEK